MSDPDRINRALATKRAAERARVKERHEEVPKEEGQAATQDRLREEGCVESERPLDQSAGTHQSHA